MKLCPGMWLVSKCHLAPSLSLTLSDSSSFTFSRILLIQGYLCWSRLAYLSQESSQILSPRFSISLPNSYQIWKHFSWKNYSVCMAIFHLTQRTSILPLSALNTDRNLQIALSSSSWHISFWDQHIFNHLHIRDRVRIHLSAAQPMYLKLLVRWISQLLLRGVRTWSLWLSMSQWSGI